jgi:hypothetical protein
MRTAPAILALSLAALLAACGSQDAPPSVSLASSLATLVAPGSITLTATASDDRGVASVAFFDGETQIGTDSEAPYTVDVAFTAAGLRTFTARATDTANQTATSSPVDVTASADTTPPTVTLTPSSSSVTAAGNLVLAADATDSGGIAKVEFYRGTTKIGEDTIAPYTLSVPLSSADNGTLQFTVKAFDNAGNTVTSQISSVTVNITPSDTVAPTVSLASSASSVTTAGPITLTATASDNVGVTKVEFFEGSTKLGEDTSSPYTLSVGLTAADNGARSYTARAFDAANNTKTSSAVAVTVNIGTGGDTAAPTVSLVAAPTGFTAPGTLTLTATATDNVGVAKVEFFDGSTKLGENTTAPFTLETAVTRAQNGTRSYTARAFDAAGNSTTSSAASVTVNIADTTAPTVTLASSANPVISTAPVTLTATASDDTGVTKVEFFDGTTKLGEDTSAPFTLAQAYTGAMNGTKALTVKAFDAAGNSATSSVLNLTVDIDTTAPTASVRGDAPKITRSAPYTVNLVVSAADASGIRKVTLLKNGTVIADSLSFNANSAGYPYSFNESPAQEGVNRVELTARVEDNRGNLMTSAPLVLNTTVDQTPPAVTLTTNTTYANTANAWTLTAAVTDTPGANNTTTGIWRVQFFRGASLLGSDFDAPYTFTPTLTPDWNGEQTSLTAVATDGAGNERSVLLSNASSVLVDIQVWPVTLTSGSYQIMRGVATDASGNIYYAGFWQNPSQGTWGRDMYVQKRAPNGNILWSRLIGVPDQTDEANDIAVLRDGNIAVAGFTLGAPCPENGIGNAGGSDGVVRILSSVDGANVGCVALATAGNDQVYALASSLQRTGTADVGQFYLAGTTQGVLSASSTDRCNQQPNSPEAKNNGKLDAFIGAVENLGSSTAPAYSITCARTFGSVEDDEVRDISMDYFGNAYVVGVTRGVMAGNKPGTSQPPTYGGDTDGWLRRFQFQLGTFQWTIQSGRAGRDQFNTVFANLNTIYVGSQYIPPLQSVQYAYIEAYHWGGVLLNGFGFSFGIEDNITALTKGAGPTLFYGGYSDSASGRDAVVGRLECTDLEEPQGCQLTWRKFFGQAGADFVRGIAADSSNNVYPATRQDVGTDRIFAFLNSFSATGNPR